VRALNLHPGMMLSQTVEGTRLILEPLHDVDSLAGSLGTGRVPVRIEKMKDGAKSALAKAGLKARRAERSPASELSFRRGGLILAR